MPATPEPQPGPDHPSHARALRPRAMRSVTLATCAEYPELTADDRLLAAALSAHGIDVDAGVWDDARAWHDPSRVVVIRSCWDYHLRLGEFLQWLGQLRDRGTLVLNAPALVTWNARKRYLLDLAAAGFDPGIPTRILDPAQANTLDAELRRLETSGIDWSELVAKPEVSASAYETCRLQPFASRHDARRLAELVRQRRMVIQPFVPEVATHGELSLLYLGGVFSHAVVKRPAPGDFRVQEEHGGRSAPIAPGAPFVNFGQAALAAAASRCGLEAGEVLYARVDVVNAMPLRLMEIELIEPNLYLSTSPRAAALLAECIMRAA